MLGAFLPCRFFRTPGVRRPPALLQEEHFGRRGEKIWAAEDLSSMAGKQHQGGRRLLPDERRARVGSTPAST